MRLEISKVEFGRLG